MTRNLRFNFNNEPVGLKFSPQVKSTAIDTLVVALKSWTKDRQLHNLINNTVESSVLQIVQRKIDGTYFNSLEYLGT